MKRRLLDTLHRWFPGPRLGHRILDATTGTLARAALVALHAFVLIAGGLVVAVTFPGIVWPFVVVVGAAAGVQVLHHAIEWMRVRRIVRGIDGLDISVSFRPFGVWGRLGSRRGLDTCDDTDELLRGLEIGHNWTPPWNRKVG